MPTWPHSCNGSLPVDGSSLPHLLGDAKSRRPIGKDRIWNIPPSSKCPLPCPPPAAHRSEARILASRRKEKAKTCPGEIYPRVNIGVHPVLRFPLHIFWRGLCWYAASGRALSRNPVVDDIVFSTIFVGLRRTRDRICAIWSAGGPRCGCKTNIFVTTAHCQEVSNEDQDFLRIEQTELSSNGKKKCRWVTVRGEWRNCCGQPLRTPYPRLNRLVAALLWPLLSSAVPADNLNEIQFEYEMPEQQSAY